MDKDGKGRRYTCPKKCLNFSNDRVSHLFLSAGLRIGSDLQEKNRVRIGSGLKQSHFTFFLQISQYIIDILSFRAINTVRKVQFRVD